MGQRVFMNKRIISGKDGFTTIPEDVLLANFWSYVERVTGDRSVVNFTLRGILLTIFANFPTVFGSVLRGKIYKILLGSVGKSCFIEKNVRFYVPIRTFLGNRVYIGEDSLIDASFLKSQIKIGDKTHISRYCSLRAGHGQIKIGSHVNIGEAAYVGGNGNIEIGDDCLLARGVVLLTGNHVFQDPSIPIRYQGTELNSVKIGDDVWLGANVIVLPGVNIGKGCVIGAGSTVNKDLQSYSIAVGSPARVVGKRDRR